MIDAAKVNIGDRLTLEVEVTKVFRAMNSVRVKLDDAIFGQIAHEKSPNFGISWFSSHIPGPLPKNSESAKVGDQFKHVTAWMSHFTYQYCGRVQDYAILQVISGSGTMTPYCISLNAFDEEFIRKETHD